MIESEYYKFQADELLKDEPQIDIQQNIYKQPIRADQLQSWFGDVKDHCSYNDFKNITNFRDFLKLLKLPMPEYEINTENIENKKAFDDFVKIHLNDLEYKNKFVAFVNGEFQSIGDKRNALIEKMYDEFGNVPMYVDKITDQKQIILIDTPEFN